MNESGGQVKVNVIYLAIFSWLLKSQVKEPHWASGRVLASSTLFPTHIVILKSVPAIQLEVFYFVPLVASLKLLLRHAIEKILR